MCEPRAKKQRSLVLQRKRKQQWKLLKMEGVDVSKAQNARKLKEKSAKVQKKKDTFVVKMREGENIYKALYLFHIYSSYYIILGTLLTSNTMQQKRR